MSPRPPIVVSMGDPAGIGPEIILKAHATLGANLPFIAIGSHAVFAERARDLGLPEPVCVSRPLAGSGPGLDVVDLPDAPVTGLQPGQPDPAHAPATKAAIERGVALCLAGEARALVTAPIAKSVMYAAGFSFPGHTEFLAELTAKADVSGPRGPAMMLAGGGLRVVLATIHLSLREALDALSAERIAHMARLTHHALKQDFGLEQPRLALAGLNPHAGEGGSLGREEIELLNPLAAELRREGIDLTDALPPDTMFHAEARARYDAAVCLYHDQGLIPVKTLDFHGGVNITLGLPIVRTSPDHGTAFDIAGRFIARPDSLIAAIRQADEMARQRSRAEAHA